MQQKYCVMSEGDFKQFEIVNTDALHSLLCICFSSFFGTLTSKQVRSYNYSKTLLVSINKISLTIINQNNSTFIYHQQFIILGIYNMYYIFRNN